MHIHWKNCPKAFKGHYHNPTDGKLATVSCEALVDSSLYCWHWFSRRCGTNNDIAVGDNSFLPIEIMNGQRCMKLPAGYALNGKERKALLYILTDGIYPEWTIFAKPIQAPISERQSYYTRRQEGQRKDFKRIFGVLQGRFRILKNDIHE